jgi:hypothetical protein
MIKWSAQRRGTWWSIVSRNWRNSTARSLAPRYPVGVQPKSATGAEQPFPEPAEPPAASGDAVPLRILLAEDAPDNRFLIQAYLKKLPYRIEIAENGQVAIEKFKATRPDLVLMDVQKTDDFCSHGHKGFVHLG